MGPLELRLDAFRLRKDLPFRNHAVLIAGGLIATLLGIVTALELDLVLAAGERLMNPVGQLALLKTTATAGLTGLLCWVLCALITRAISRNAVRPYDALADHFERLSDGGTDSTIDLKNSSPGARRLARAAAVFHQKLLAGQRAQADLQARYDSLCGEHSGERRRLMDMMMSGQRSPDTSDATSGTSPSARADPSGSTPGLTPADFDLPDQPSFWRN